MSKTFYFLARESGMSHPAGNYECGAPKSKHKCCRNEQRRDSDNEKIKTNSRKENCTPTMQVYYDCFLFIARALPRSLHTWRNFERNALHWRLLMKLGTIEWFMNCYAIQANQIYVNLSKCNRFNKSVNKRRNKTTESHTVPNKSVLWQFRCRSMSRWKFVASCAQTTYMRQQYGRRSWDAGHACRDDSISKQMERLDV